MPNPKTIKEIMSEFDKWCFNNKSHLGRNCDISEIKTQLSSSLSSLLDEVKSRLPKKILGHVNQEGFCDNCHYKLCRCSQFNYVIDTVKSLLSDLRKEIN